MKAHDDTILVGSWKLVSWVHEDTETGVRKVLFGEHPTGCLVFTASGRVAAILTGEGRKLPKTLEDRIDAYGTMVAYSGTYRIDGSTLTTRVDIAWDQSKVGTDQVRFYKIDGDRMEIETPPFVIPHSDGRPVRSFLTWQKEH
jgi:Lipocalin-like domain